MARNTYYHRHPRGFANECEIVRAETPAERSMLEEMEFERLTRAEMARHIRYVNAENDAWGSNRAFGAIRMAEIVTDRGYSFGAAFPTYE